MRRLLVFLRPYWRQLLVAFVAISVSAAASIAQPYLVKVAIDTYIARRDVAGLQSLALLYLGVLPTRVLEWAAASIGGII